MITRVTYMVPVADGERMIDRARLKALVVPNRILLLSFVPSDGRLARRRSEFVCVFI